MAEQSKPGYCPCGTKLLTKYITIGKCVKCQYSTKGEYTMKISAQRDELLGITKEERAAKKREIDKRYRQRKKEQKQGLLIDMTEKNDN